MNQQEIGEMFIRAAEVDRKLPDRARPAALKAMNMGYVHTFAEMNGWDEAEKHAANWAWLDPKNLRATTNDIGLWEAAMEMITLVPDPKKRRALWAWARAKAGGKPFSKWCKEVEDIKNMTGHWRKRAAIECISRAFARNKLQNNDFSDVEYFTEAPEISDIHVNIAEVVQAQTWRDDAAFSPIGIPELRDFSWASKRNEIRRKREADRRKQKAA